MARALRRQDPRDRLLAAVGGDAAALLFGDDVPDKHCCDWSRLPPVRPLALARPRDVATVSALLRSCDELGIPVVPQGGLTGLAGGAHPVENCLALSLERLTGIEKIDRESATMTVRAGTTLAEVQDAADTAGLEFALDLGSRGSCTVGGILATNAGGNRVIRYGPARQQVLGLEFVLADGTVVSNLRGLVKDNTGYDLGRLMIGSEGTLGIITRAVLQLQPRPLGRHTAVIALSGFAEALALLAACRRRLGPALSAFEVMWPDFWSAMGSRIGVRLPLPTGHGMYALVETGGFDPERDRQRFEETLHALLDSGALADVVVARSGRETAEFWRVREAIGELRGETGPLTSFDVSLSAVRIGDFVAHCRAAVLDRWPDALHLAFGHLGDNNIHIVVHVPSRGTAQPKAELDAIVYGLIGRFGGSISAEHGIGILKRDHLPVSRDAADLTAMRRIKQALDPHGILNPGKLLPG